MNNNYTQVQTEISVIIDNVMYTTHTPAVDFRSLFFSSGCILIVNLPKVAIYAL